MHIIQVNPNNIAEGWDQTAALMPAALVAGYAHLPQCLVLYKSRCQCQLERKHNRGLKSATKQQQRLTYHSASACLQHTTLVGVPTVPFDELFGAIFGISQSSRRLAV